MLALPIASQLTEVLCIGAHCDDVEIGCGGTLAALVDANPALRIRVVTFASDGLRAAESRAAFDRLLPGHADFEIVTHAFRDGYFPAEWSGVKDALAEAAKRVRPDAVFTHFEGDRHQDHRILGELTWNHFRDHLVLQYEIPKFDGDLGSPNAYMPLTVAQVDRKVAALMNSFPTQAGKRWFTEDTFRGLMRLRGIECQSRSGFAEAFYARKLVLGP